MDHSAYIWAAYGVAALLLGGEIAWVAWRLRAAARRAAEAERSSAAP